MHSNNLKKQSLEIITKFVYLEELFINNDSSKEEKRHQINGSLKSLEALTELQYLDISNTEIELFS